TIDLSTHFLRPVKLGSVTTEGQVTEMGRSIAFMEGKLFDMDGQLCARATTSAKLFDVARFSDA
ncbi:MAG: PaaI family thioesterase, partial [Pseudomonadota bacterium]